MRLLLYFSLAALLTGCAYTAPGHVQEDKSVGVTGNIQISHEKLTSTKHMITVGAAPGLGETEGSIGQRIVVAANRYAAKTCPKDFSFDNGPNNIEPLGASFMLRSRTFLFRCL